MMVIMPMVLAFLLLNIFYFFSFKFKSTINQMSVFECGYKSYFFSRFSFSIHFFFISLIFLFLDLELCITMVMIIPSNSNVIYNYFLVIFILVLFWGLILEWLEKKLEWIY